MKRVLIIAEAGVNHNGNIDIAKRLVDVAKESKADIVKFQTYNVDFSTSKNAEMANYQKINIGKSESPKEMLKKLALSHVDFVELQAYCKSVGIQFLSTPFDIESIEFLEPLQEIWKIPSGEITNYPYLVEVAKSNKKIILSTGMSTIEEIHQAIDVLSFNGSKDITLLHCTSDYPTPMEDVNLNAMITLKKEFNLPVGYSDHTKGIEVSIAAVAMGASVIEKHFTLDRNMNGPDHKASLEPGELKMLVSSIRNIELAKGSFEKKPTETEMKNRQVIRKSIVAARRIEKGEEISEDNITAKRARGGGLSPMIWNTVIGTKAIKDFEEDEVIII